MKIGYPCINRSIGCTANSTFRLKNYSESRLIETIANNLTCLQKILAFNVENELYFFRISSDIIPFASHPLGTFPWATHFASQLQAIGNFIRQHGIRISMHPSQFVLLNAQRPEVVQNSIAELAWHCQLLDAMMLDTTAKVQIHVGGMYGDKVSSIKNFIACYQTLADFIKQRLVIENDDRLFTVTDCLAIYQAVGIPIIFDNLHHECHSDGETLLQAMHACAKTWAQRDGLPMVDYSSQEPGARLGKHAEALDDAHFSAYLQQTKTLDFDIMLEIKNKEPSALMAIAIARRLRAF